NHARCRDGLAEGVSVPAGLRCNRCVAAGRAREEDLELRAVRGSAADPQRGDLAGLEAPLMKPGQERGGGGRGSRGVGVDGCGNNNHSREERERDKPVPPCAPTGADETVAEGDWSSGHSRRVQGYVQRNRELRLGALLRLLSRRGLEL